MEGFEFGKFFGGPLETFEHLFGGQAPDQGRRQQRAGTDPQKKVKIGKLEINEIIVEGLEAPHLERGPRDCATGQNQRLFGVRFFEGQIAFLDDSNAHFQNLTLPPNLVKRSRPFRKPSWTIPCRVSAGRSSRTVSTKSVTNASKPWISVQPT